ncbi:MAG: hypothetical protein LBV18_05500 [Alistipes sp.]|nr:hypothetical protein [Alistipes sp.]
MKKILFSMIVAALGWAAASCTQDHIEPAPVPGVRFQVSTPRDPLVITRAEIATAFEWSIVSLDVYAANAGIVSKLAPTDYTIFPNLGMQSNQTYTITLSESWLRTRIGQTINFYFVANDASSTNGPHTALLSNLASETAFKNSLANVLTPDGATDLEPIIAPDGTADHNLLFSADAQAVQISTIMERETQLRRREARFDIQNKNFAAGTNQLVVTGITITNAPNTGLVFGAGDAATPGIERTRTINIPGIDPGDYNATAPGSDVVGDMATSVFYLYPTTLSAAAAAGKTQIVIHAEFLGVARDYPVNITADTPIQANFRYILKVDSVTGQIDIVGDEYEEGGTLVGTPGMNKVKATLTPDIAGITGAGTLTTRDANVFSTVTAGATTMEITAESDFGTTFELVQTGGEAEITVTKVRVEPARAFEGIEELYTITIPDANEFLDATLTISSGKIGSDKYLLRRFHSGGNGDKLVYLAHDGTLTAGTWDEIVAAEAEDRVLLFKFGGISGISALTDGDGTTGSGSYADGSIEWYPEGANKDMAPYTAADWDAGIRNISDPAYNTAANARLAKGDPCKLLGLKTYEFLNMTDAELQAYIDAATWRTPTVMENLALVGGPADPDDAGDPWPTTEMPKGGFWKAWETGGMDYAYMSSANSATADVVNEGHPYPFYNESSVAGATYDNPVMVNLPVDGFGAADGQTAMPIIRWRDAAGVLGTNMTYGGLRSSTPYNSQRAYTLTDIRLYPTNSQHAYGTGMAVRCVSPTLAPVPAAKSEAFAEINGVKWAKANVRGYNGFAIAQYGGSTAYQWGSKEWWAWDNATTNSATGATWRTAFDNSGLAPWPAAENPCPKGYMVPTVEQFETLLDAANVDKVWLTAGTVAPSGLTYLSNGYEFADKAVPDNFIFLTAAGGKNAATGVSSNSSAVGAYWSATPSSATPTAANYFRFDATTAVIADGTNGDYNNGYSVRCVVDDAPMP